uniref:Sn-12-diacylglycerol ethanolamine-and cholinephosphotransferase n=1 Tax=Mesocestoides corti TaxID=53468 RepID=A0A5K3EXR9_MESCO
MSAPRSDATPQLCKFSCVCPFCSPLALQYSEDFQSWTVAMPILSERMKDGVRKHKYACIDTSPLSNYVMHPFWNCLVGYFPRWIAPNTLTVLGFCLTVLDFLILTYYDPDFKSCQDIPQIIWLLSALLLFTAHTLDGIDGKQARRLGQSSPLGELMDHCCDAWTAAFYPSALFSIFSGQMDSSTLFTCQWIISGGFLISHWEKSLTGVLYLPWTYDFGQLALVLLFVITFFTSPSIWFNRIPYLSMTLPELTPYIAHGVFWPFSITISVVNVIIACANGTARIPSPEDVIRPLAGNFFVFVASWIWMEYSPTQIMDRSPRFFLLCATTVAANITCRVILAEVTKTKAPMWSNLIGVYSLVVFTVCFGLPVSAAAKIELPCLFALTFFVTIAQILFGKALEYFASRAHQPSILITPSGIVPPSR